MSKTIDQQLERTPAYEYANLEVNLRQWNGDIYVADMRFRLVPTATEAQFISGPLPQVKVDRQALLEHWLDPIAYGAAITKMLFADERLVRGFVKARTQAESVRVPLRFILRLDVSDEQIHSLSWETLHDPERGEPLGVSERILLSRLLDSPDMTPIELRRPANLTALIVVANPTDLATYQLAPIDEAAEVERGHTAMAGVRTTVIAASMGTRATINAITTGLRAAPHILYLVCHGSQDQNRSYLWLEQEDGTHDWVDGAAFAAQIARQTRRPGLIVLVACQSAGEPHDAGALAAVGPLLAQAGVPAVIAMQDTFSMLTASVFIPTFFREFQRDGQLDRAMAIARGAVLDRPDWWVPVLFSRLQQGRLWENDRSVMRIPQHAAFGGVPPAGRWPIPPITLTYRYKQGQPKSYRSSPGKDEVQIGLEREMPLDLDLWPDQRLGSPHLKLSYRLNTWWASNVDPPEGTSYNGVPLGDPTPLTPGDRLELGDTVIAVAFTPSVFETISPPLIVATSSDASAPPASVPEEDLLTAFTRISRFLTASAFVEGQGAKLEVLLREIARTFPIAEHISILLPQQNDRHLLPVIYWPPERSYVSFSIARRAITNRQASLWQQQAFTDQGQPIPESFQGVSSAIYAPMVYENRVVGLIHLDATEPQTIFTDRDRELLQYIAQLAANVVVPGGQEAVKQLPSVYIAHAAEDQTFVERLTADLRRRRISVVRDDRRRVGPAWDAQLQEAIVRAQSFLLIHTPGSDEDHVRRDISTAIREDKPILLACYQDDAVLPALPAELARSPLIRFTEDYEAGLADLIIELRSMELSA